MLYKPKFMSPDLNMDVKWAYYDDPILNEGGVSTGNYKPVTFSCVCDGNSIVSKFDLELTWSDTINGTIYYFKKTFIKDNLNLYPIDYNNEYMPIELEVELSGDNAWDCSAALYSTDKNKWSNVDNDIKSSAKDKKITAKYILTSESGQEVYNYSTFYFKSKPTLTIKTKEEYDDSNNSTIINTLKYSDQVFYGVLNNLTTEVLNQFPVQYYYWEIYDIDKNKILQSKKTYSQDIQFRHSNFINNNSYTIKCVVCNTLEEQIYTERVFSVSYELSLLNFNYSYRIFPKETAIYFNWDTIRTLSGQLYELNGVNVSDKASNYKYYDNSGNLKENTLSLLHLDNQHYLSLNNLHEENNQTLYWAGYIHPYYNTFFGEQPILSIEYLDDNNLPHTLQLLKTNEQEIFLKIDNQIPSGWVYNNTANSDLTYRKGKIAWYIISINIANKKLTFIPYNLTSLTFPETNWLLNEGQQYLNIGYGEWEDYNDN